jgi:pyrroline-5-carboxylate reductase
VNKPIIAFIGAGNMASSIIGGLVESGHPAQSIRAADPLAETLERLQRVTPVTCCADNPAAVSGADVVILAIKPQVMSEALASIAPALSGTDTLVISIAAGITITSIQQGLEASTPVVRCMPNTPSLLGCGASALHASPGVSEQQRAEAEAILGAVGTVHWVPREQDLDTVTALSGSGPAYFFLFTEAMIDAACELGLARETATALATQTALGAARMATESDIDLVELRRRVTSPGGTTQAAVESFERDELRATIRRAVAAAADRAAEMARE